MKKLEANDLVKLIAALAILIIGFIVSKAYSLLTVTSVVIGGTLFFLSFVLIGVFVKLLEHLSTQKQVEMLSASHRKEIEALASAHREEISSVIQRLQKLIPPPQHDWLLTDKRIVEIEEKVEDGTDIWIVSPDLEYDVHDRHFQQAIEKNFQRGITYTYIVPKSLSMGHRVSQLRKRYSSYPDLVKIREVPEDDFRLLAITHIDIYDPYGEFTQVFLQLPERGYWIQIPQKQAESLIRRFTTIVAEES